jgi:hypothetical protein
VTTLDAHHLEPYLNQRCDDFLPCRPREPNHQPTVTFCTPTKSSDSSLSPWTSRQS